MRRTLLALIAVLWASAAGAADPTVRVPVMVDTNLALLTGFQGFFLTNQAAFNTAASTNSALAGADNYFLWMDTNGAVHLTPWRTNDWLWVTNSSAANAGYTNAHQPLKVIGPLTAANLNGTVGSLTNGGWLNPSTTNLVNYGSAVSSPGSGSYTLQLGQSAAASAQAGTAVGYSAAASGISSTALGTGAAATGNSGTAVGALSTAGSANNTTALGASTTVGDAHANSTAVGYGATTTAANQIMLGSAGISAVVNNWLSVLGGLTVAGGTTNLAHRGYEDYAAGADVAFTRYALSTLANGNNAAIPINTNVFVEVSGPTAAFTVNGIAGGRDGKLLVLVNRTGQNMTLAHDSGVDPAAGNRIYCYSGADERTSGNGAALLIYSANASRWLELTPLASAAAAYGVTNTTLWATNTTAWGASGLDVTVPFQLISSGTNITIAGFPNINQSYFANPKWAFTNSGASPITVTWPAGTRLMFDPFSSNSVACTVTNGKTAAAEGWFYSHLGQTITQVFWKTQQN